MIDITEEKRRVFGYDWGRMWPVFLAVPFVVAYIVWRHGRLGIVDGIVVVIAFLFVVVYEMLPMYKVLLTESEIDISFMLPTRRGGRFRHDEIESYTELAIARKGRKILVCGLLQPKGRKSFMLARTGTKAFEELNSILSEMYPKLKGPGQKTTEGGRAVQMIKDE